MPATFADAAAGFLHHIEHVRGREQSTLRDYRGSIDAYLNPRWGDWPVSAVTPDDVERFRDELIAAGEVSPRTIVRHLTVAHGVFKYAMRKYGLERNPAGADLVDRPSVNYSGEFMTLDPEQLAALVRAAETEQDAVLYLTAAQTGLRQGELRALRWRDVDFAADRIHAQRSRQDGGGRHDQGAQVAARAVGADGPAGCHGARHARPARTLHRRRRPRVPERGRRRRTRELLRRRYYRALKAAGLPRIRFHDLRHAFGSTAVKAFPLSDVQAMLGHAHISTTMRYVHHRPGKDDAAKLAAAFGGEAVTKPPLEPRTGGSGETQSN